MMDGTFVKELERAVSDGSQVVSLHGIERLVLRDADGGYSIAGIEHPEPMACALDVATLSAVVDFLKHGLEDVDYDNAFVHVESPTSVKLVRPAACDAFSRRQVYVRAKADIPGVTFGTYASVESWIITLMSCFDSTPDLVEVLACLSNLRDEKVKQAQDDGLGQIVTTRAGIALVGERRVPTMPALAPRRTFIEVEQPRSSFVLRLKSGGEGSPMQAGLFEADGGAWRSAAMAGIAGWLKASIALIDPDRQVQVVA